MESSIAAHLQVERTRQKRKGDTFSPPYPSFSARFDPTVEKVVMAYYGVQFTAGGPPAGVEAAVAQLLARVGDTDGPEHHDQARYVDEAGYHTIINILYWSDDAAFTRWAAGGQSWTGDEHRCDEAGYFLEVLQPTVQRYETLFSNDRLEGVSVASAGLSGEIREHGYWGGARDRMPLAQTDRLAPEGEPTLVDDGDLVRVLPHENICLIRSGQDWMETEGDERRMYLDEVEPVLRAGMNFLRDHGLSVGCFANRYMLVTDDDGTPLDKSFGMSWWRGLEDLESWSESHPTHVAIFGAAMKYLSTMGPAAKLRLYHEITVAEASQQSFEYLRCHDRTGMLRSHRTSERRSPVSTIRSRPS